MISRFERLPNELLVNIFSYLLWNDLLISFWSLNKRINSLICLNFSTNKNGIIIGKSTLSYKIFLSKLFPLISNCSTLINSIRHIHLDGRYSNGYHFLNKNGYINKYPNLKSLILNRFYLSEIIIENLSFLIEHRLKELTMILDNDIFTVFQFDDEPQTLVSSQVQQRLLMFKELLCQIFSERCQLIRLRFDIPTDDSIINIHQCLSSSTLIGSRSIKHISMTLRYIDIRVYYACFIENIIECAPNLERLSVYLKPLWNREKVWDLTGKSCRGSNTISFNEKLNVQKLKCFILKSVVEYDSHLYYLKWFFNNLNNVEKIKIHLRINGTCEECPIIHGSIVDADFIHKYLIGDITTNLIHFDFYIISKCKFLFNYTERTINSFKIHPFFIERQWINVKCLFDQVKFYQHLSSSSSYVNHVSQYFHNSISYPDIVYWPIVQHVQMDVEKDIYLHLEQFDEFFPKVSCIKFHTGTDYWSKRANHSIVSFEIEQYKVTDIHLRYVTRLDFGLYLYRQSASSNVFVDQNKRRAKMLAHIISMPIQLTYLRINEFQWLLHIIEYALEELKENALSSVKYTEFSLLSSQFGPNASIRIGKYLVPFLTKYMPYLQTLCLWKQDDFPWSSIRPDFNEARYSIYHRRWSKTLRTVESINQHVTLFENDLSKLVKQLKHIVYLDIYGKINDEKVEAYRLMVQKRFPSGHFFIEKQRFQFWI